jgi:hypothetical protein
MPSARTNPDHGFWEPVASGKHVPAPSSLCVLVCGRRVDHHHGLVPLDEKFLQGRRVVLHKSDV